MFEGFFEPVPLWMILLFVIWVIFEIRRNKPHIGSSPNRRIKKKPIRSVVRRPKQSNYELSNYGSRFEKALLTFKEKISKHKSPQKAWDEASYDEKDAYNFHSYRFIQQFLNIRLAPTFVLALTDEAYGPLGAYASPLAALCLKVYVNEEQVGEVEIQPISFEKPFEVTVRAK